VNLRIEIYMGKPQPKSSAIKIVSTGATIPKPTAQLLTEMAAGIHLAVAGRAAVDRSEDEDAFPTWDALPDNVKDYWLEGARCAYAIVAIHGGASTVKL